MVKVRVATLGDFQHFEGELLAAFRRTFEFDWRVSDESSAERALRQRFALIASLAEDSDTEMPSRSIRLLRECFSLRRKLQAHLRPDEQLRSALRAIALQVRDIGTQLRDLERGVPSPARDESSSKLARWQLVERAFHGIEERARIEDVQPALVRLAARAEQALVNVRAAKPLLGLP